MSRRRTLRPDEQELWQAVARTANPLHPIEPQPALGQPSPETFSAPVTSTVPPKPSLANFTLGEKSRKAVIHNLAPSLSDSLTQAPILMDAKAHARMTRGKLVPEARIDLHGMTLAESHPELIRFILNSHAAGFRLVLVITGKGKQKPDHGPIPQRMGVLRHQVPLWLRQIPLAPCVLQISESHLKHGGAGAYYVYLRRPR
ncbi:MAG: Smr/MutS family protein [Candidatus Saccharibacteria bacterium]|nr:Smr/MutS family protein [Pseudorhodobacter sp.]